MRCPTGRARRRLECRMSPYETSNVRTCTSRSGSGLRRTAYGIAIGATLGGPGTGGGPWGTTVDYTWVEVDADDTPVAEAERTEGLSATDVARPGFTAPALAEERVVRYRFTVQGRGYGNTDFYTASDTVTVTVRAAPAVTAVALTSAPQNRILPTYRRGETIEVSVTFSRR